MNPFQPMTYKGCANPKKEPIKEGKGKYLYDIFYELYGEIMTGTVRGDNKKHAKQNFINLYGDLKINHYQRYPKDF